MFYVFKHSGDPEGSPVEDAALRSREGFTSFEEASEATKTLFSDMHLVMIRERESGEIVAVRPPGRRGWPGASE
jgi:hypothetical protein